MAAAGIPLLGQVADRTLLVAVVWRMELAHSMLPLTVASELRNMT